MSRKVRIEECPLDWVMWRPLVRAFWRESDGSKRPMKEQIIFLKCWSSTLTLLLPLGLPVALGVNLASNSFQEDSGLVWDLILSQSAHSVASYQLQVWPTKSNWKESSTAECGVGQDEAKGEQGSDHTRREEELHGSVPGTCEANRCILHNFLACQRD